MFSAVPIEPIDCICGIIAILLVMRDPDQVGEFAFRMASSVPVKIITGANTRINAVSYSHDCCWSKWWINAR